MQRKKISTGGLAIIFLGLVTGGLLLTVIWNPMRDYFNRGIDAISNIGEGVLVPEEIEEQAIEIQASFPDYLPFYRCFTEGIANQGITENIPIYNDPTNIYSGGSYIIMYKVEVTDQELEDYFKMELYLKNGSAKVVYARDPFTSVALKYNFLVKYEGNWYMTQRAISIYAGIWSLEVIIPNLIYLTNN